MIINPKPISSAPLSSPPLTATVVPVGLGKRSYAIEIGQSLLATVGESLKPHLKRPFTVIVTDDNIAPLHLAALQASLTQAQIANTAIILPAGEKSKSFAQLEHLCDQLLAHGVERKDCIIAFGGGVMGDLVGFAAAILRRGVGFIQIPTSMLAQVDSSVGGKTGINTKAGKNLIGAFHQPQHVIADINLLETLPPRELASGYAEVVKYALLGDPDFFTWLEQHSAALLEGDALARQKAVAHCCQMKAEIVASDETEQGARALLNLGHTFGHALEAATHYSGLLRHGEAVAIGMVQAFRFSEYLGLCAPDTAKQVAQHLKKANLPTEIASYRQHLPSAAELVGIMHQDKKAEGGKLTFILVHAIGEAFVAKDIAEKDVYSFLEADMQKQG